MGRRRLKARIQASSGNFSTALPNCQPSANIHPACSRRQRAPATSCGINQLLSDPTTYQPAPALTRPTLRFASLLLLLIKLTLLPQPRLKFLYFRIQSLILRKISLIPHIHEPLEHGAQLLHVLDQMNFLYLLGCIIF
jgi:hypothetical protein